MQGSAAVLILLDVGVDARYVRLQTALVGKNVLGTNVPRASFVTALERGFKSELFEVDRFGLYQWIFHACGHTI